MNIVCSSYIPSMLSKLRQGKQAAIPEARERRATHM